MNTFSNLYNRYKDYYIFKHSQAKFNRIEEKIRGSTRLISLNNESKSKRLAPSATDFAARLHELTYFIFSGKETTAMGELIAIKIWNDQINSDYKLCNERDLFFKGESVINRNKIQMTKI